MMVDDTVSFYMIRLSRAFGNSVLRLANIESLILPLCVGAQSLFGSCMGALPTGSGDALRSRCTILMLLTAYPAMLWLVASLLFEIASVELWLSFIYGSYNGAMVVF